MGDDQQGAGVIFKCLFQPGESVHIQIVGRLIQDDQVRLFQEQPGQSETGFLAATHCVDGCLFPVETA